MATCERETTRRTGRLHPGVLTMPPMQPIDEYDERLVLVVALT